MEKKEIIICPYRRMGSSELLNVFKRLNEEWEKWKRLPFNILATEMFFKSVEPQVSKKETEEILYGKHYNMILINDVIDLEKE